MFLPVLQRVLPASVKNRLKPYYRTIFPNRLHILWWVTFRCNYRCSYCPVVTRFDMSTVVPASAERTPTEWIQALQTLPSALIYVSGGEPFLFKGLTDVVNNLGKHSLLGIVTNATAPLKIYERIQSRVHLNISYHREFIEEEPFLQKVAALSRLHHVQVNIVATPENLPLIREIERTFTLREIDLHVDPFFDPDFNYTPEHRALLDSVLQKDRASHVDRQQDHQDYDLKECSAGRNYLNILPNGDVYTCAGGWNYVHSPLHADVMHRAPVPQDLSAYRMGNLFDGTFALRTEPIACRLPCAAACDLDAVTIRNPR